MNLDRKKKKLFAMKLLTVIWCLTVKKTPETGAEGIFTGSLPGRTLLHAGRGCNCTKSVL